MQDKKAPFKIEYVNIPFLACIILVGILLAILSNLPFAFLENYYTESQLRLVAQNNRIMNLISIGFYLVFIIVNSLFFCFRSQVPKDSAKKQLFSNIAILAVQAAILFVVFFTAPSHQISRYWLVPSISVLLSLVYIILCMAASSRNKR